MEIILQQNFHALGYVGDRVKVKPGFGRNFLIPQGIAVEASSRNQRVLKHRLTAINAKRVKLRGEAADFAKTLESMVLEFNIKIGAGGRSFGSISIRDIEAQLKEKGVELDRRQIRLPEPIKRAGESTVQIKLHAEVSASVPVIVRADVVKSAISDEGAEGAPSGRARRSKKARAEDSGQGTEGSAEEQSVAAEPAPDSEAS